MNVRRTWIVATCLLFSALTACLGVQSDVPPPPTATTAVTATAPATAEPTLAPPTAEPTPLPEPQDVWEGRIFYEIFVRSFYDSNGDGVGDFNGITERLDYLNDGDPSTDDDLGITGIWLMPMMQSRSYHGYDVTDYYRVEPDYGTREDFKRLVEEAHKRGIIVIIDLVLNHTSSEHPWFIQSRNPDSPFRDWYRWETNNNSTGWHQTDSGSYYGIFWEGMPDLNYRNPIVSRTMYAVSKYWLEEYNIDGFRLDAIKFLYEEGNERESIPETYDWFTDYNAFLKSINPNAMIVGEIWSGTPEIAKYVETEGVDLAFEFAVAESFLGTARGGGGQAAGAIEFALQSYPDQRFATFVTNHDQSRVVSQLFNDPERAKPAATLLLTSPGVPFIYYGEEIGMLGQKPDELIRTPMQWLSAENGGFTTATPWQPLNDSVSDLNVADQTDDPNSILSHYRTLIRLRQQYTALDDGGFFTVNTNSRKVHAALRTADDYAILVVVNGGREPVADLELTLPDAGLNSDWVATELLGGAPLDIDISNGGFESYIPFGEIGALESKLILLQLP